MRVGILAFCLLLSIGCASRSVTPDIQEVEVSREEPSKDCVEIGPIQGTTTHRGAKPEDALQDMKDDASKKGANFVRVEQYSSLGGSVSGVAYKCP